MNREETLDAARHAVTGREIEYGGPEQSFERIAALWSVILGRAIETHEVALCLDAVKTARLMANPTHQDSWIDKAGYAACGAECAHIAQESRCVSETPSDGKTVAENTNANIDPVSEPKPCQRQGDAEGSDDGWIDHDGSDRCPVTDGDICVEVVCSGIVHKACVTNWQKVDRWRIAEVDGWRRWSGGIRPVPFWKRVSVVYRCGQVQRSVNPAGLNWTATGSAYDIIAYRPA